MIKYKNIVCDYNGEYFKDGDKNLTEFSIPVEVMTDGLCRYTKDFEVFELDETTMQIKPQSYTTEPFYSGAIRYFTNEPKYEVPSVFESNKEEKNLEDKEKPNEELER